MEKWIKDEVVYDGEVVTLRVGEVELEDGTRASREVVEHAGGVAIVPFTGDSVIFVKQYRIAAGDYVLEIPAGKLEDGDAEDTEHRAKEELEEETGHRAGELIYIGHVYAAVGYCTEKAHIYLALDLKKTEQRLDPEERIELVELPMDVVMEMLREHGFNDAKTVIGLQALVYHLEHQGLDPEDPRR